MCHLSEETLQPKRDIPEGIFIQLFIGFDTTLELYIALSYAITFLNDIFANQIVELYLATVYPRATESEAATTILLVIFTIDAIATIPGAYISAGLMVCTLGRDCATLFSSWGVRVSKKRRN